jgi:Holliday junction resolvase RusA-like endonuclease
MTEPATAAAAALTVRVFFVVPGQVPHRLSPNRGHGRANPRYTTKLKSDMREIWAYAIRRDWIPGTPPLTGPLRCEITYFRAKGEKRWDGDNLLATMKVGLDQLQALGVIENDSQLQYEPVAQTRDPDGWGFVEIVLEAA